MLDAKTLSVPAIAALLLSSATAGAQVSPPTARFASTPVTITVPASGTSGGFYSTAMGDGNKRWALVDVTGDRKPDLIQTADPKTGEAFSNAKKMPYWKVFVNNGTAMQDMTTFFWTLPDSGTGGGFRSIGEGQTIRQWALLNLRSPTWPDLVQFTDPGTNKVFGAGSPPSTYGHWGYWKLYNIESVQKFNQTPNTVILRPSGKDKGFSTIAAASGTDRWTTMDINGDTVMDIVQTVDPATGKLWVDNGKPCWHVFRGTTTTAANMEMGMYGATAWPVPDSGFAAGFTDVAKNEGTKQWVTFDIDGDHKPDLVQTADPKTGKVWGAGTSNRYWHVFKGTGAGFAPTATLWPVPDAGLDAGFAQATSGGAKNWVTIDLDGDGKPDLVQTSDNAGKVWGAGTPNHYWKMFKNTGVSFFATPTSFPVPQMGLDAGFFAITQGSATKWWTLVDINGDGRLDLVQTADPATGAAWGVPAPATASGGSGGATGVLKTATPTPIHVSGNVVANAKAATAALTQAHWRVFLGQP